jgi:hypothetical protein
LASPGRQSTNDAGNRHTYGTRTTAATAAAAAAAAYLEENAWQVCSLSHTLAVSRVFQSHRWALTAAAAPYMVITDWQQQAVTACLAVTRSCRTTRCPESGPHRDAP